jgi:RsiW-degrading membrane proteinase PrsW (M82 family)
MNMGPEILGVSMPMFTSVASGLTLSLLTAALFWLVLTHRGRTWTKTHRVLAWTLLAGVVLHGIWGVIAVFVLKS